jgi:hypothetical protein
MRKSELDREDEAEPKLIRDFKKQIYGKDEKIP